MMIHTSFFYLLIREPHVQVVRRTTQEQHDAPEATHKAPPLSPFPFFCFLVFEFVFFLQHLPNGILLPLLPLAAILKSSTTWVDPHCFVYSTSPLLQRTGQLDQ